MAKEQETLNKTIEFWRNRGIHLCQEDARVATENICAFVETVARWKRSG